MAQRLVIATGNPGKLAELRALLAGLGFELLPQSELGVKPAPEDAPTFVENALTKARHASAHAGLPALADDSGLCVDALAGAPGVHSARYAGQPGDDAANNAKLLRALADVAPKARGAHFHSSLVLVRHARDPAPLIAQGDWQGRILEAPRGAAGFGYDPLFWVQAENASAAELAAARKNAISHRGQAMRALRARLESLADQPASA